MTWISISSFSTCTQELHLFRRRPFSPYRPWSPIWNVPAASVRLGLETRSPGDGISEDAPKILADAVVFTAVTGFSARRCSFSRGSRTISAGEPIKPFSFNAPLSRHATFRAAPSPTVKSGFTSPYPNSPIPLLIFSRHRMWARLGERRADLAPEIVVQGDPANRSGVSPDLPACDSRRAAGLAPPSLSGPPRGAFRRLDPHRHRQCGRDRGAMPCSRSRPMSRGRVRPGDAGDSAPLGHPEKHGLGRRGTVVCLRTKTMPVQKC
jgi:hypothetical protein